MDSLDPGTKKQVRIWLYITIAMVLCMVFIGGVTRLTDSGLSMVEWRPLLGAVPPMNDQEWSEVFQKYQQYPEYKIQNHRMNLSEFKFIFFWEYFHRLFGRLVGLVFFLPYAYFLVRKKLNKKWNRRLLLGLVLGGSQGLLGWFMVKSGLVDRPDVSHFRLAAHFFLALGIMGYLLWLALDLRVKRPVGSSEGILLKRPFYLFSALLAPQLIYGAFVAGLDAGIGYNTFPKMGRDWVPSVLFREDFFNMALNSNVGVQFVHRVFGWLLFAMGIYIFGLAWRKVSNPRLKRDAFAIGALVCVQFGLGVATILSRVELSLASAHQMVACLLAAATVKAIYDVTHINKVRHVMPESANKTTA